jgi:hypothetical protein
MQTDQSHISVNPNPENTAFSRSNGFFEAHRADGLVTVAIENLLNSPDLQAQLTSVLGFAEGPEAINNIFLSIEPGSANSGHHRAVYKISLQMDSDKESRRGEFALKFASDAGPYRMTYEECLKEVEISKALQNSHLFMQHGAMTLGAVEFSIDPKDIHASKLPYFSKVNKDKALVCAQLDVWVNGPRLHDLVRSANEENVEAVKTAVQKSMSAIVQMWRDLRYKDAPVVFDSAADDIIIASGAPVFIDLDGGRRCSEGSLELMLALQDFSKSVLRANGYKFATQISPLVLGPAIGICLSTELGKEKAIEVVSEANLRKSDIAADFRLLFLPEISRIVGA